MRKAESLNVNLKILEPVGKRTAENTIQRKLVKTIVTTVYALFVVAISDIRGVCVTIGNSMENVFMVRGVEIDIPYN